MSNGVRRRGTTGNGKNENGEGERRKSSIGALLPWIGCCTEEPLSLKAATHHIDKDQCSITVSHMAYEYLRAMRVRGIATNVIDAMGNFVDRSLVSSSDLHGRTPRHDPREDATHAQREHASDLTQKHTSKLVSILPWPTNWEKEFWILETPKIIFDKWVNFLIIITLFNFLGLVHAPIGSAPEHCPADNWVSSGTLWTLLLYCPLFIPVVVSLLIRRFVRNMSSDRLSYLYPVLVVIWHFSFYWATMYVPLLREVMRIRGGHGVPRIEGRCARTAHVTVTANYSNGSLWWLPKRTCIDRNQLKTVLEWPFPFGPGCESMAFDSSFPRHLEMLFLFPFLRCSWKTTAVGTLLTGAVVGFTALATGLHGRQLCYILLLHSCVGCVTSFLCYVATQESRNHFAKIKQVKFTAKQSRKLLYTLIPPNVLARLASHSPDKGVLATDIVHCTIMFCSLSDREGGERKNEKREFQRLHAVCLDFDEAVNKSRLYKYQHVGPWYIIACPNAAAPFVEFVTGEKDAEANPQRNCMNYDSSGVPKEGGGGRKDTKIRIKQK